MSNTIKIALGVLLALVFFVPESQAQEEGNYYTVRDLESWMGIKVKYKLNKQWGFSLEHQYRLKDNARVLDQKFTEFGIKRKIGKQFSLAVAGRYLRSNDTEGKTQGMESHFRWNTDLGHTFEIHRFTIGSRIRYQRKQELQSEDLAEKSIRLKAGIGYNIKKWKLDPEFSTEIFNEMESLKGLDKIRFTIGTSYKLKKFGAISGFYRIEKELVGAYPATTNIFGIKYQYTFKNKKK
ncbi:MAG: putative porin [Luteibaculaceae bacterium]|jgi:predicted porin